MHSASRSKQKKHESSILFNNKKTNLVKFSDTQAGFHGDFLKNVFSTTSSYKLILPGSKFAFSVLFFYNHLKG